MPEGPECKIIAERLAKIVSYKTITSVEIISGRYTDKNPTGFGDFVSCLPARVVGAGVHGKFIYWIIDGENFIWSTLGMTGSWSQTKTKHSRIKFGFDDGTVVYFTDPRNFGTIKFVSGKHVMIGKLKSLGPDMLSSEVKNEDFLNAIRTKNKKTLVEAIMDQSVIAGVGNYIKSDSLWMARLSPHRLVKDCSDEELFNLNRCIQIVIKENYKSANANDFDNIYKEYGYTRKHLVYNQQRDPNDLEVTKEQTKDRRSTYWVPQIQK